MRAYLVMSIVLVAAGCGTSEQAADHADAAGQPTGDAGPNEPDTNETERDAAEQPDTAPEPAAYEVPPRRWTTETTLTHDVDRDLAAVLERDRLSGACERWEDGARDEETKMLCGKWMFFYETFGTVGIPTVLLTFAQEWYQEYYGAGFENFGFVADPLSPDGMPLGLAETTGVLGDDVETRAFTCAACHFGKMADGRYAVGYGNMSLEYGRFVAGLGAPLAMTLDENSSDVHPDLRAELLSYVQTAKQDPTYQLSAADAGLQLLSAGGDGQITVEEQGQFLALEPGTMDFLTKPLVDDGVWTVSRILPLWNIPSAELREAAGMEHELLSWTGGATNLATFISGFVAIGVADPDAWTDERIEPLEAYIRSLRVPALESQLNQEAVERGATAFVDHGCADCHSGPSGESPQAYSFDEVGTDPAMASIFNPNDNDELCCGFGESDPDGYVVTRGVKAPRITGVENQTRWLHNGAVPSLGALLCLTERPSSTAPAQSAEGHEYGCDLDESTRNDLIEYLRSL